jgi:plastocyanin
MTMLKLTSLVAVAVAGILLTASHVPAARPASVDIKDFRYGPAMLTVPVGAQVTWTNHDEESHTITSATGAFGSAGLSHDETFTQTFARPGTYAYFCALHPQMRATIVVR